MAAVPELNAEAPPLEPVYFVILSSNLSTFSPNGAIQLSLKALATYFLLFLPYEDLIIKF